MQYRDYLQTEHWKNRRKEILVRDGNKCSGCSSKKKLQVHHLNYKNLGCERNEDLVTLCKNCHFKNHPRFLVRQSVFFSRSPIVFAPNLPLWSYLEEVILQHLEAATNRLIERHFRVNENGIREYYVIAMPKIAIAKKFKCSLETFDEIWDYMFECNLVKQDEDGFYRISPILTIRGQVFERKVLELFRLIDANE